MLYPPQSARENTDKSQLSTANELAIRRGTRFISNEDLIFQFRHDAAKVSRVRSFLSWKDLRKNVKDSDDKGGDADDAISGDLAEPGATGVPVEDAAKKNKKTKVGLPWEPASFYHQNIPELEDEDEDEEMNAPRLQRLRKADERTKDMTKEEYIMWSEYRHASFTWRKVKRFKEWSGLGTIADSKPNEDITDILGFLIFEMVQTLTEEALKIKDREDMCEKNKGNSTGKKRKHLEQGLFDFASEGRVPVEAKHVQQAFMHLQVRPKIGRAMLNGTRLRQTTKMKLVSFLEAVLGDRFMS